jgi:uncharacterized protein (DUF2141 family)
MRAKSAIVGLLLAVVALAAPASAAERRQIAASVGGMRNSEGQVLCALFKGPKGFPDAEHAVKGARSEITGGRATCRFTGLAEGVYAVAVFHDEDKDGDMDTILGIPTEGFGFSNNAKPRTFGPPPFSEAAFRVKGKSKSVSITMLYL